MSALSAVSVPEGVAGRAFKLTHGYASKRSNSYESNRASAESSTANLLTAMDVAVPDFCDWCSIDIGDDDGVLRRFAIRSSSCSEAPSDDWHEECCAPALNARVSGLAQMAQRVFATGRTEVWPNNATKLPWCVIVAIFVNDQPYGTVAFTAAATTEGYGFIEIAAAEEVAWHVGAAIERVLLHHDAREAVRRTQRIASQLHQLIAASITVTGLRNESDVILAIANSSRNVFDASTAIVALESGPSAPLRARVDRGQAPVIVDAGDDALPDDLPPNRPTGGGPWEDGEWLVASLVEHRSTSRGILAVRRRSRSLFGDEDKEILTLLAQVATRAIDSVELARTIQNSEARWRILVETAPVGIVEIAADKRVKWWNRAAARLFGWSEFSQTPSDVAVVFPDASLERFATLWTDVINGMPVGNRELLDIDIGARRRDLTTSAALLPSSRPEERSILMLVDDVTDQRELKAELRHAHRMEIRGQVASNVAHDFNNLLTLISGYAEILTQDVESQSRAFQMVKDIQATAYRASMLTRQLQTIGRTKPAEPVVLDPTAVIESNAEVLERIVGVGVEIDWDLQVHSRNVRVDADQFEQMILNLALNARDAMAEGGRLHIEVGDVNLDPEQSLALGVRAGVFILLRVSDTGIGMDEETRRRCFEPLFTTKGPFKGTGLGLAAARRLIEESGGAIRCSSALGEGTTFDIYLPVVDEIATEDVATIVDDRPRGSATVLLAENDEGLRRLMSQVLRRNGYEVLVADSAERALEMAQDDEGNIDLLLSDVVMDEISGPELAKRMQAASPSLRVLLISGTADARVLEDLVGDTGAFLAKPFKPSELVDQIHELLSRRT